MSEKKWYKANAYWWVPLAVVVMGGVGFLIKDYIENKRADCSIVGQIKTENINVDIQLDGKKLYKIVPPAKMYRFDNVKPGKHELLIKSKDYHTISLNITGILATIL